MNDALNERIISALRKAAMEKGTHLSESEARARVNDKYYNEIFAPNPQAPDLSDEQIRRLVENWL